MSHTLPFNKAKSTGQLGPLNNIPSTVCNEYCM